ncbi:AAA family ATPase [Jidongwangia harbinensis]|uniref:AAA family ATPase n=1 Tax=Jidongwangia harbinensis TaxID=2878561 RepID=UPI001CD930DC|nr:AAA family ATPase [Jidongwangia harbinensis]MCA2212532.1 AAA family ATPase [Jidongwangia harbinensis]
MDAVCALRSRLRDVFWIGGGSGAGKSTVARRLAARYGLHLYATDDVMSDHARRSTAGDCPFLHEFMAMDMDERWLDRSPEVMLDTFHWFRGEGFGLIVDDLLGLPAGTRVVVEGFRLLPRLVRPLLGGTGRAVWLLPTPAFRRDAFESRGSLWRIAGRTSDPERALRNLLARDAAFTERLAVEVHDLGLHAVEVHPAMTEDDLTARVAAALRLTGRPGPGQADPGQAVGRHG